MTCHHMVWGYCTLHRLTNQGTAHTYAAHPAHACQPSNVCCAPQPHTLLPANPQPKSPKPDGEDGDATGSDAAAAAADGSTGDKQQQQQQVHVTRSLSQELQLEFVVDEPAAQRRLSSQWRARRPLVHTSSLRGRVRQAVKARSSTAAAAAAAAAAPLGPGADAEEDAGISADVIPESPEEQ
jgi:hypothetical protein